MPGNGSRSGYPALPRRLSQAIWLLLLAMAVLVGRACVSQNVNYVDLRRYAQLEEQAPFQSRILMAPVVRMASESAGFHRFYETAFRKTVDSPEDLAVQLVDCGSLLLLLPVTVWMRREFHPGPGTSWLAPLLTLLVAAITYVVRYEQRFTMPYDLLSVLFFTLGLLAAARGSGWLLLAVMAVGTPNRETTLFLIPVWCWLEWRARRFGPAVIFGLAGLAIWVVWGAEIRHILHSPAVAYVFPWRTNLSSLAVPTHWAQILSAFGFLALPMWMLRDCVRDPRLRRMWAATGAYLAAALIVGIWRETRIFGELSALVGVTFAMQLEQIFALRGPSREPSARSGA